jgi:hypothetical protein
MVQPIVLIHHFILFNRSFSASAGYYPLIYYGIFTTPIAGCTVAELPSSVPFICVPSQQKNPLAATVYRLPATVYVPFPGTTFSTFGEISFDTRTGRFVGSQTMVHYWYTQTSSCVRGFVQTSFKRLKRDGSDGFLSSPRDATGVIVVDPPPGGNQRGTFGAPTAAELTPAPDGDDGQRRL